MLWKKSKKKNAKRNIVHQIVNDFPNGIYVFMNIFGFWTLDDVYFQDKVVCWYFSTHAKKFEII